MRRWYAANAEKCREAARRYAKKSRKRIMRYQKAWNAANPERATSYKNAYTKKYAEKERARKREYKKAHRGEYLAACRLRQLAKRYRTPPWADTKAIKEIYRKAAVLRASGMDVHVDHRIPLQGKTVSGLHVPGNLAIISGAENLKKRNRWAEDS